MDLRINFVTENTTRKMNPTQKCDYFWPCPYVTPNHGPDSKGTFPKQVYIVLMHSVCQHMSWRSLLKFAKAAPL